MRITDENASIQNVIRHLVCIKLKDAALVPRWQEDSQVLDRIETLRHFIAAPLLNQERYHCALYMEFDDEAGLQTYLDHPVHLRYRTEVLVPILEDRLVVDIAT